MTKITREIQIEIYKLVNNGYSYSQVAEILNIGKTTVHSNYNKMKDELNQSSENEENDYLNERSDNDMDDIGTVNSTNNFHFNSNKTNGPRLKIS